MRILVTGGAGFIGSHLVEKRLAAGYDVAILDDFNDFYDPQIKHATLPPSLKTWPFTMSISVTTPRCGIYFIAKNFKRLPIWLRAPEFAHRFSIRNFTMTRMSAARYIFSTPRA